VDGGAADRDAEPSGPKRQIRADSVTIWIGLLLTACVTVVLALTSWRRRVQMAELGTVSAQWLSEHRGNDYAER